MSTPIDWSAQFRSCGDGSCVFGPPKGMRTNGGCQHLKLNLADTRRLLRALATERARIVERLRARAASEEAAAADVLSDRRSDRARDIAEQRIARADVLREMADEIERGGL